jgi:TonB family protein
MTVYSLEESKLIGEAFKNICTQVHGEIVNMIAPDVRSHLSLIGKAILPVGQDFYPHEAIRSGRKGRIHVAFVLETDGQVSWAAVVGSSGDQQLDGAAIKLVKAIRYSSPAFWDFTPVRMFGVFPVSFGLH